MSKIPLIAINILMVVMLCDVNVCEARYLPTRSQEDRLVKLKELIQELLKSEERNLPRMREQYGGRAYNGGYLGLDDASTDEGYPITYDNRDADSRIVRRLYRQQQITKT